MESIVNDNTRVYKDIKDMSNALNNLSFQDLDKNIKMTQVLKFYNMKMQNPLMSKKDICKNLSISLPTLNQYLKDLNMGGFVRNRTVKKKKDGEMFTKGKKKGGDVDNTYDPSDVIKNLQTQYNR